MGKVRTRRRKGFSIKEKKRKVLLNAKHPLRPRTALSVANNIALALKVKNHLQGVQLNIVPEKAIVIKRALCKFHLEDQRHEHNERTSKEQDEKANNPEVHVRDAQDLLAGSELDIEELLGKNNMAHVPVVQCWQQSEVQE